MYCARESCFYVCFAELLVSIAQLSPSSVSSAAWSSSAFAFLFGFPSPLDSVDHISTRSACSQISHHCSALMRRLKHAPHRPGLELGKNPLHICVRLYCSSHVHPSHLGSANRNPTLVSEFLCATKGPSRRDLGNFLLAHHRSIFSSRGERVLLGTTSLYPADFTLALLIIIIIPGQRHGGKKAVTCHPGGVSDR